MERVIRRRGRRAREKEDGGSESLSRATEVNSASLTDHSEIALVHYPSIQHFNDMLAGEDYQAINAKHRQKVRSAQLFSGLTLLTSGIGPSRHTTDVYDRVRPRRTEAKSGQAVIYGCYAHCK